MTDKTIHPFIKYRHITDLDLLFAKLIYPILVELAPTGQTMTYKDVVEAVQARHPDIPEVRRFHPRHVGRRLGTIWLYTHKYGYPHIGALVVNQATGNVVKALPIILTRLQNGRR